MPARKGTAAYCNRRFALHFLTFWHIACFILLGLLLCMPAVRAAEVQMPGIATPHTFQSTVNQPQVPTAAIQSPTRPATPNTPSPPTVPQAASAGSVSATVSPAMPTAANTPGVKPPNPPQPVNNARTSSEQQANNPPQAQPQGTANNRNANAVSQTEEATTAYAAGDYRLAERIWREQADEGDGQAMNNLGVLYDLGQGVEMDMGRALHWFAESAKTGNTSGMSNYGRMLEQGRGIAPNPEEAARWFDLAARQGQAEAQYNLGILYEIGRGVPKDVRAAAAWYSRAAAQQQTEAMFRLGHCYRVGQGVEKNSSRAVLLFYASAMNGDPNAMRALEDMAREGGPHPDAVLFGQRLDSTDRTAMREALHRFGVKIVREDDAHICDQYEPGRAAPGARRMALCYGPGHSGALGFLELDYDAPNNTVGDALIKMVTERFGPASAGEGEDAHLWNLGSVIVATRYEPTRSLMSLMYMVPRVYHLTRKD